MSSPPKPVLLVAAPGLHPPVPPRPKTVRLSLSALCSLPQRLFHPPPARGLVTSWTVTPKFDLNLDDVLDRKHLPPLGLKDFEEWLLFVEQAAENLYFILWLQEYTRRYSDWIRSAKLARSSIYAPRNSYRAPTLLPPANHELSYSYQRAKRTFLTPNGDYELDVPSDVLAPFHVAPASKTPSSVAYSADHDALSEHAHTAWSATTCGYGSAFGYGYGGFDGGDPVQAPPPPDPAVFAELAELVREMLADSLERFVRATYNNVGTPRAVCGSAGGIVIGLIGALPMIVNFAVGGSRWWRFAAFPLMWAGLTIFISAMRGVCMMIYIFGDLRQLRSFELVRPPISDPQPHPSPAHSVASLFQPRLAPAAPPAPLPPQPQQHSPALTLNPFRRAQRRSMPEISAPMPLARPRSVTFGAAEAGGPPRLHIVTAGTGVGGEAGSRSRWSEESGSVRAPERAVTRAARPSVSVSVSTAVGRSSLREEECASRTHDSGYEEEDEDSDGSGSGSESGEEGEDGEDDDGRCGSPCIEISDAFYDEHPSPEGPATASFPLARGAPLWPDYAGSEEEVGAGMGATAGFIHPYAYEDAGAREREREKEGGGEVDLEAQTFAVRGPPAAAAAARDRQRVDPFDFDALPPRRPRFATQKGGERGAKAKANANAGARTGTGKGAGTDGAQAEGVRVRLARLDVLSFRSWMGLYQSRCSPENVVRVHIEKEMEVAREMGGWGVGWGVASTVSAGAGAGGGRLSPVAPSPTVTLAGSPLGSATAASFTFPAMPPVSSDKEKEKERTVESEVFDEMKKAQVPAHAQCQSAPTSAPQWQAQTGAQAQTQQTQTKQSWRQRFRRMQAVPAFAVPLTPVLSPVVTRAQWEIVVRSAALAVVVVAVIVGGLVAVPVPHVH